MLNTYVAGSAKPSTLVRYACVGRCYMLPTFGKLLLRDIAPKHVREFAYGLVAKGLKRNTILNTLIPLSGLFRFAVKDELLVKNPASGIAGEIGSAKQSDQRPADFLTREELGSLLRCCRERYPRRYPLIALLAKTGLRIGEALALEWDDIDFHGRFIQVSKTTDRGRTGTPKNGKSRRVDMSLGLAATLKGLRVAQGKYALREGASLVPFLFPNRLGRLMDRMGVYRYIWAPLLKKAGFRQIHVHDLRHTFASLLIQNGESLAYVKEQMGHSSIKMTVDTYGHIVPGGNKAAVDKLDGLEDATIRNPAATSDSDRTRKTG